LDEIARGLNLPPILDEGLNEAINKLDIDSSGTIEMAEFEVLINAESI
jgi:hypothetical protein